MRIPFALLLLASLPFAAPAHAGAETLTCPDLAQAKQVATCPALEELRYTYSGYCGDNARLYGRDTEVCASFESYRAFKNIALWESADGRFSGYLSCEEDAGEAAKARATRLSVSRRGSITLVKCEYEGGIQLAHRTHASCAVAEEDCATGECRARCE
ncbi:hypothetical protein E6C76_08270 [Pseudothauera nasutitermitis]|uniref:Uncharacterized protein n=1 Tax=Pseudothauera nasutitermitis TaxID=2565930 RepID=A0A4V3WC27_9RHOO|nr:hypothetical protein [Pseudothauera nasutitermitis]THF65565.1 hypothetical protein E6C76_08270 [Pseudothauera nasutitermitis]